MKKSFIAYASIWAVLLAVFNVIVFLVRPIVPGIDGNNNVGFWISWGFVILAFVGNLACTFASFKTDNLKKRFYNISLITVSYIGAIVMTACGVIFMLIPHCPAWVATITCVIAFAIDAIAIIKTIWARNAVVAVDEKVDTQTSFIKNITVDAQNIMERAKSDTVKTECKKVYEALRYSDPMSCSELESVERQLTTKMADFAIVVDKDDVENAMLISNDIVTLSRERNNKCRSLK